MNKVLGGIILVVGVGIIAFVWRKDDLMPLLFMPRNPVAAEQAHQSGGQASAFPISMKDQEVIAENLEIPWELAFLPDGSMLVTERPGKLLKITDKREEIPIAGVEHEGEGGLLGLALHPDFASNHFIYLYLTTKTGKDLINRVDRYMLTENVVSDKKTILDGIPGSSLHDGGRIAFGPDKKLYITTGDAGDEKNAQDTNSLSGKILRVNDDGSIPDDNPFHNAVYSYGHRNVQGIAWDSAGSLWATEHGRSIPKSGFDEINLIVKGRNYGWPTIQGGETKDGMELAIANSGADDTWAPSGMTIVGNGLFFAGLRGQALYRAELSGDRIQRINPYFAEKFGRLRTVVLGPDKQLYILTNNTDGRGEPKENDDKIIRINPDALK